MTTTDTDQKWRERSLFVVFVAALVSQNAIAIPYVRSNGPESVKDFFVGDILKTTPGRFAMVDLTLVVIGFHLWAFAEAADSAFCRGGRPRWF